MTMLQEYHRQLKHQQTALCFGNTPTFNERRACDFNWVTAELDLSDCPLCLPAVQGFSERYIFVSASLHKTKLNHTRYLLVPVDSCNTASSCQCFHPILKACDSICNWLLQASNQASHLKPDEQCYRHCDQQMMQPSKLPLKER